jgi:hypothetical protein
MQVRAKPMSKASWFIVTALSLVPPLVFIVVALFEPWFYGLGWDKREVSDMAETIRVCAALLVIAMMVYFAAYLHAVDDPSIEGKKSLWTWILILGNILAVPVFWYVFIWRPKRGALS